MTDSLHNPDTARRLLVIYNPTAGGRVVEGGGDFADKILCKAYHDGADTTKSSAYANTFTYITTNY